MARGCFILVLHAHLPYVRHPEHPYPAEELWLFEAITECYLPLLRVLEGFARDRVACRMTLSLSPTLICMLQDRLLQQRYLRHLGCLQALARAEIRRARHDAAVRSLARMYLRLFTEAAVSFRDRYHRNLVAALRRFAAAGMLELITTTATHAFLPLLKVNPASVRAQVAVGAEAAAGVFGAVPPGIWLPECGYYPGLAHVLRRSGYRYFFLESHGLLNADPSPVHGIHAPIACAGGIAAFCRDPVASQQVWSSTEGYPGDPVYREFYRDIAQERDPEYVARYMPHRGDGVHTGLKYWRITGHEEKELYDPAAARERAREHARHFIACRIADIEDEAHASDRPAAVTVPFDAELFGHWWFEGPVFLDALVREASRRSLEMVTPSDYLRRHPRIQEAEPAGSSWGALGYNDVWLNEANDWLYPQLHAACTRMEELVRVRLRPGTLKDRALRQAGRSLLLAQASDWPFIMRTGTAVAYARSRIRDHLARFHWLSRAIAAGRVDARTLRAIEVLDNIFPDIDPDHFRPDNTMPAGYARGGKA